MCRERQSMSMFIRSEEELFSFQNFCIDNPQLRFWQALSAWVGEAYDVACAPCIIAGGFEPEDDMDTFYWEWEKDGYAGVGPQPKEMDNCRLCELHAEEWNDHAAVPYPGLTRRCKACGMVHTINKATHTEEWEDGEFVPICDECAD